MSFGMKCSFGLCRFDGIQAEDLDPAAGGLFELQPGPDHAGIVEDEVSFRG